MRPIPKRPSSHPAQSLLLQPPTNTDLRNAVTQISRCSSPTAAGAALMLLACSMSLAAPAQNRLPPAQRGSGQVGGHGARRRRVR
jgi:hypothetical protein